MKHNKDTPETNGNGNLDKWLTQEQVMAILKRSLTTVKKLRRNGYLRFSKVGGDIRIHADDVDDMFRRFSRGGDREV